jgi:hypothetical protein
MVRELSQPKVVFRDLVGMPDVIAFKAGHTLLIECKRPSGKLRNSQRRFFFEVGEHIRNTLKWKLVNNVDEFASWLIAHEKECEINTVTIDKQIY